MPVKSKKIYKGIKKQEKKIAKKEVKKAKTMIKRNHKWTIAASALGYHGGYDRSSGFFGGKGGIKTGHTEQKLQTGVKLKEAPARSTAMFSPYYTTKKSGKDGLMVSGLQKWAQIGYDNTSTTANKQWLFINTQSAARTAFLEINPDAIGGAITTDAQSYEYFLMKEFEVIFVVPSTSYSLSAGSGGTPVMTPSTLDNVNMAVGYFNDDNIAALETIDYSALQASNNMFEHQTISPWGGFNWKPKNVKMRQVKWFNTELTQSTAADKHMCCQGIVYGFYDQNVFTTATTGTQNFKIGDVYIKYKMQLKGRISTNGITAELQSKAACGAVYNALKTLDEEIRKDSKDDGYTSNSLMRRFDTKMKKLKAAAYLSDPVPSNAAQATTKVIIVDSKYDGTDATKLATVSTNTLQCASTISGTQAVNVTQVGGSNVTAGFLPTDLKRINGTTISSVAGVPNVTVSNVSASNIPVVIQDGTALGTNYLTVSSNAANVGLAGYAGTTLTSTGLPVNVNGCNGATFVNTSNPSGGGLSQNSSLPVQIWGYDSAGHLLAQSLYNSTASSGTSSNVSSLVVTGFTGTDNETKSAPISPTESMDGFVTVKKRDYKAALKRGLEMPIKQIGDKAVIDPIDKSVVKDKKESKK